MASSAMLETLRGKHIYKFAPDMSHAAHLPNVIFAEDIIGTGIAIRMHPVLTAGRVFDWIFTLPINRKLILRTWRRLVGPRPFISDIVSCLRFADAFLGNFGTKKWQL